MRILFEFNQNYFTDPSEIIICRRLSEAGDAFARMEKALRRGCYLAGFLSYEAGYAFEKFFHDDKVYSFPLICFGVYRRPTRRQGNRRPARPAGGLNAAVSSYTSQVSKLQYLDSIQAIKRHLAAGDAYQVNYTFKLKFDYRGTPFALYQQLKSRQPTPYSAFVETDEFAVLSHSPELFFEKKGEKIRVSPMKGTIRPGQGNAGRLKNDAKNRSENLMIVDLLRNDLGRIARTGSVKTSRLFEVEKHPTLYQMTSTVEAKIPRDIKLFELFCNLFPSGSVTGAPKISTMRIIRELEKKERKIYTGSIGFITPQRDMLFNVAIRTVLLRPSSLPAGRRGFIHRPSFFAGEMGVGSGIVYDSDPKQEYEECRLKARFLARELDRQNVEADALLE